MFSGALLVSVSLLYLLLLFAIALHADRQSDRGRSLINNPWIYGLSLAVYCTAWTYFGSVGRAAQSGVGFLPVYLGPTLGMTLSWLVFLKMIRIARSYRITSIADFIASRYGKSHLLGGLVSIIALVGTVPYLALQLKAVSGAYRLLTGDHDARFGLPPLEGDSWLSDTTLYMALILAAFTIFFGTRHMDAAERHEGMVAAIAFESLVKLLAFLSVGVYVTFVLYDGMGDIFNRILQIPDLRHLLAPGDAATGAHPGWFGLTLLSLLSVLLLPRQFQVTVVENVNEQHLRRATWLFPAYLLLINLFVLPIAFGGLVYFDGGGADPDTFVLTLPMSQDQRLLTLLVFIGGLSAATGMVIVETIAVSTMVCNDLVMPLLIRSGLLHSSPQQDLSGALLAIRRSAIVLILLLGYLYFRLAGEAYALVSIGLISFAAVAQFAPALLGGMYWRGGRRSGALAGLSLGFLMWAYTLLLPSFAKSGWLDPDFLELGLFELPWLRPEQLFGMVGMDNITHALFWSLSSNTLAYVLISLLRAPDAREAAQASLFVDVFSHGSDGGASFWRGSAQVQDLLPLVGRFLGMERARQAFLRHAQERGYQSVEALPADATLVHFAETQLSGAIGSASARVMVSSVVKEEPLGLDEVLDILDEASEVRAYSRELEQKSRALEDATKSLRAANERLQEFDRLKDDFMSSVSHELRTPLTSIRAFSELLRDDPSIPEEERTRFLSIIVSETERLTRLVNQVLDLAKIESGNAEWQAVDVPMAQLAEQAAGATSQLFRDKGAQLRLQLPDGAEPVVRADPDRLMQVLINLLSNAVKVIPAGHGDVLLALEWDADGVTVSVSDNGPGIPPGQQEQIFEKFRQGGDGMDKPPGTGLGLPISRQILEHFGGWLKVRSQPGEGATFYFHLPVSVPQGITEAGST